LQVFIPSTLFVMTLAFASAALVNPASSFAAAAKQKSSDAAFPSAVDHTEARIKQLQTSLKITDAQQVPWNNLTQVMRENAKAMDALTKDKAEEAKSTNAVERMKFHSKISEARLEQLKKMIPPFEALYASLSDEQKKTTDSLFPSGEHKRSKAKR